MKTIINNTELSTYYTVEAYLWKVLGSSGSGKKVKQTLSIILALSKFGEMLRKSGWSQYIWKLFSCSYYSKTIPNNFNHTNYVFFINYLFFIRLLNRIIGQKSNKHINRKIYTTNFTWWMVSTKIQNQINSNFMKGTKYVILKPRIYALPKYIIRFEEHIFSRT